MSEETTDETIKEEEKTSNSEQSQESETKTDAKETNNSKEQSKGETKESDADKDSKHQEEKTNLLKGVNKWKTKAQDLQGQLDDKGSKESKSEDDSEGKSSEEIREIVAEAVAPIKTSLEASDRARIDDEFAQKPLAGELAEDIAKEAASLPKNLTYQDRLNQAYNTVVARPENLEKIRSGAFDEGKDAAYDNKSVKEGKSMGESSSEQDRGGENKTVLEQFEADDMSQEDRLKFFEENKEQIEKERLDSFKD